MTERAQPMVLHEVLCRYLRDLRLRTFPDNDEGDHGLRWTAAEIKRVEQLIGTESALAALNAELLEALERMANEFQRTYPVYYYAEPWGHETNAPLLAAKALIAKARNQQ